MDYQDQLDQNKHELNMKKLFTEVITGTCTKDTTDEFNGEGAANFKQLQEPICKECDKRNKK